MSAFVDDNNRQIVTKVASVLFKTKVKTLRHYDHLFTFRNFMLDLIMHNTKALKDIEGEENMIKVALLQVADVVFISSYTLKERGRKAKEQHEKMNKV